MYWVKSFEHGWVIGYYKTETQTWRIFESDTLYKTAGFEEVDYVKIVRY